MNKFIAKIFKNAGVDAKVSKSAENPRFKVVDNKLTLEGVVRPNRYTMSIKDNRGKQIDNLSVIVSNSNDIVNRINESINTLKLLSSAYDQQKLVEEDEEFDNVVADEEIPETVVDGLDKLYDSILDVADEAEAIIDVADEDDADQLNTILGFVSTLYDVAIDVDDYKEELTEVDEEDMDESVQRKVKTSRGNIRNAVSQLTMVESMLRGNKEVSDILTAVKDIKSELIVRGY
jgi:hypothetical protein